MLGYYFLTVVFDILGLRDPCLASFHFSWTAALVLGRVYTVQLGVWRRRRSLGIIRVTDNCTCCNAAVPFGSTVELEMLAIWASKPIHLVPVVWVG